MKPLSQINSRIKVGTKVKLTSQNDSYYTVKEIYGGYQNRNWVKLEGLIGSFQAGHIRSFTNN